LKKRQYEVHELVVQDANSHLYHARDRRRRQCSSCGSLFIKTKNKFCEECGSAVSENASDAIKDPLVVLWESANQNGLPAQQQVIDVGLKHPAIVQVYESFEERSRMRPARFYAVQERLVGTLLTDVTAPQPAQKVVGWMQELLAGLNYLASKGYHCQNLTNGHFAIVSDRLKLVNVEQIAPLLEQDKLMPTIKAVLLSFEQLLDAQAMPPAMVALFDNLQNDHYESIESVIAELDQTASPIEIGSIENGSSPLYWQTGRLTDVGQARQINEDSLLTLELAQVYESISQPLALFAVADGMGGHEAGEAASRLAAHTLGNTLLSQVMSPTLQQPQPPYLDYPKLLEDAFAQANLAVYNAAQQHHNNMGTTLVAALLVGSTLYVANVGDSRAYLMDETGLRQITEDHSYVKLLIEQQQLSPQEAQDHPQANLIYRTLGDKSRVTVDIFQEQLTVDSWLLLCSDGLTGLVSDDTIQQIIQASKSPQDACQQLIKEANEAGGHDNITAIAVKRITAEG